jgi:GR25 family glycosyltransferase involved in LPS biosynthesis
MYRGFFINLDRNQKRRESVMRNLAEAGLSDVYERVPAIDGRALGSEYVTPLSPGNQGLWLTHERLMRANLSSDVHLHVIEDDALLPADAKHCLNDMLDRADGHLKSWDLIFTDIFLQLEVSCFQLLSQAKDQYRHDRTLNFFPMKYLLGFAGTSSIFFNKKSIGKYLNLLSGNWTKGLPIDFYLRSLVKQQLLDAYITMPFLTSLTVNTYESDIGNPMDLSQKVLNLYRLAAYKDANLTEMAEEMRKLTANSTVPTYAGLFLDTVTFLLSDRYINF